mmetsp:Transcript_53724/g.109233  ORF Transcript_53724/g.109233 Transcript_53724/m.109233 type:complete len:222 (+) Transcript_53724:80-745(+)
MQDGEASNSLVAEENTISSEEVEYLDVHYEPEEKRCPVRPPTRGRGHEERPSTEAMCRPGRQVTGRRVVHVDHHHVHHHHHYHGAYNLDRVSSPDADLQRHELKAEAEAEWTLEEKIRPKRPGPVAPRRPRAPGRSQQELENSLASELCRLQTSTFSTFGGMDFGSKASCLMGTSMPLATPAEKKPPAELQLQEYFQLMSCLPMQTRLKLSPYTVQLSRPK